jgi:hypothetical protein
MRDIESLIGAHRGATPRRPLSSGFTDRVMAGVDGARRDSVFRRAASACKGFAMHKITKPAALLTSLGLLLITTGTGFAALKWIQPDVKLDSAQGIVTLSNGDKRFWVDYKDCPGQGIPGSYKWYYEIKSGSRLTPEQLTQGLLASCESDMLNLFFPQITQQKGAEDFTPYQDQYFTPYATFVSAGDGQITVDTSLNGKTYHNVTLPVDRDAAFYRAGKKIKPADLHKGNTLSLVTHTHALSRQFATETLRPDQLELLAKDGFPIGATVKGAVERQYDVSAANTMYEKMGTDWTRLTADKNAPDGWRQIAPLR